MYVISAGTSYLDALSAEGGHFYSYPEQIKSSCAFGKPYHFWMAAYLARQLRKKHYSQSTAALAVHIISKGYEFTGPQRDPQAPRTRPLYDDYNNEIRLDMAFNDAGAVYGAADSPDEINVDNGILELMKKARPVSDEGVLGKMATDLSKSPALSAIGPYIDFNTVFSPDSAFTYFLKTH